MRGLRILEANFIFRKSMLQIWGINRATYTQMKNGKRKFTADALLNEHKMGQPAAVFARSFEKLDENDQAEIMNLIKFKEQMKMQRS